LSTWASAKIKRRSMSAETDPALSQIEALPAAKSLLLGGSRYH
jgi:hypothetical protein